MALVVNQNSGLVSHSTAMSNERKELIKRVYFAGSTDDEFELFRHICEKTGLDPIAKQIHPVKRYADGKQTITFQTGIDGYRLIADRTKKYMPGRECTFSYDKEGKVFSSTAYVKKLGPDNQWHEISHTVYWSEYVATKRDGTPTANWESKPHVMLGKCAEAAVLRKAFPADLSGLYTSEEMEQAGEVIEMTNHQFVDTAKDALDSPITLGQVNNINELIGDDLSYKDQLLSFFKISSFDLLPQKKYDKVISAIQRHNELRMQQELNMQVST